MYSIFYMYCTCTTYLTCTVHVHVQYIVHVHVRIYFPFLFRFIGEIEKISEQEGVTVFEKKVVRTGEKRKREDKGTPDDIDGYKGKKLYIEITPQITPQCF